MKLKKFSTLFCLASLILFPLTAFSEEEKKEKTLSLSDISLEELLNIDIITGDSGGFGKQLDGLKIKPYIHGYSTFLFRNINFRDKKTTPSFDLNYFNPILGFNIQDKIAAEIMLEFEHGGSEVGMRYGIVDYSPFDFITLRVGKFLTPIGKFNEYLYAEHINIFAERPLPNSHIIPVVWSEIGAQLRGNFKLGDMLGINYATYVCNGLEQQDGKYGGEVRSLRDNTVDVKNLAKSFGGRIGATLSGVEIGGSLYKGPYSQDGLKNLSIYDVDLEYKNNDFEIRGEYMLSNQETDSKSIDRNGFFVETGYKFLNQYQPTLRYEYAMLNNYKTINDSISTSPVQKLTAGFNYYPLPNLNSTFKFKLNYSYILDDGNGKTNNEYIFQSVIAF
ncbi:MAG: hypothetical protein AABZ74_13135 [Cyanobacteriota bacterium]